MKILSSFSFLFLISVSSVFAQAMIWRIADSTYCSGNGYVLALPHNEIFVVSYTCKPGFSVFKYDANGNAIFRNNYSIPNATLVTMLDRATDENGNLFIGGYYDQNNYNGFLVKIDSGGNQQWLLPLVETNYNEYINGIAIADSGFSYVTGERVFSPDSASEDVHSDFTVHKVDSNGAIVWSRYFGDGINNFKGNKIIGDKDGNVVAAGSKTFIPNMIYEGHVEILKYDHAGNLLWGSEAPDSSVRYNDLGYDVNDISLDSIGNAYICGREFSLDLGIGREYPFAAKFNSEGVNEWFNEIIPVLEVNKNDLFNINGYFNTGALDDHGNYYAGGYDSIYHFFLAKYSPDGSPLWTLDTLNAFTTAQGKFTDLKVKDNYLYACGSIGYSDYLLAALDLDGNTEWTARYNSAGNNYDDASSVTLDNDGNVLVSGNTSVPQTYTRFSTTIKYSNFLTGIVSPSSKNNFEIHIYPNPSSFNVNISFNVKTAGDYKIEITDIAGRVLQQQHLRLNSGDNQLQISVKPYASGIYFIRFADSHGIQSIVRFIKE